jgi:hypothetical protein
MCLHQAGMSTPSESVRVSQSMEVLWYSYAEILKPYDSTSVSTLGIFNGKGLANVAKVVSVVLPPLANHQ